MPSSELTDRCEVKRGVISGRADGPPSLQSVSRGAYSADGVGAKSPSKTALPRSTVGEVKTDSSSLDAYASKSARPVRAVAVGSATIFASSTGSVVASSRYQTTGFVRS